MTEIIKCTSCNQTRFAKADNDGPTLHFHTAGYIQFITLMCTYCGDLKQTDKRMVTQLTSDPYTWIKS